MSYSHNQGSFKDQRRYTNDPHENNQRNRDYRRHHYNNNSLINPQHESHIERTVYDKDQKNYSKHNQESSGLNRSERNRHYSNESYHPPTYPPPPPPLDNPNTVLTSHREVRLITKNQKAPSNGPTSFSRTHNDQFSTIPPIHDAGTFSRPTREATSYNPSSSHKSFPPNSQHSSFGYSQEKPFISHATNDRTSSYLRSNYEDTSYLRRQKANERLSTSPQRFNRRSRSRSPRRPPPSLPKYSRFSERSPPRSSLSQSANAVIPSGRASPPSPGAIFTRPVPRSPRRSPPSPDMYRRGVKSPRRSPPSPDLGRREMKSIRHSPPSPKEGKELSASASFHRSPSPIDHSPRGSPPSPSLQFTKGGRGRMDKRDRVGDGVMGSSQRSTTARQWGEKKSEWDTSQEKRGHSNKMDEGRKKRRKDTQDQEASSVKESSRAPSPPPHRIMELRYIPQNMPLHDIESIVHSTCIDAGCSLAEISLMEGWKGDTNTYILHFPHEDSAAQFMKHTEKLLPIPGVKEEPTRSSRNLYFKKSYRNENISNSNSNSNIQDWQCSQCGYVNFARRGTCRECNASFNLECIRNTGNTSTTMMIRGFPHTNMESAVKRILSGLYGLKDMLWTSPQETKAYVESETEMQMKIQGRLEGDHWEYKTGTYAVILDFYSPDLATTAYTALAKQQKINGIAVILCRLSSTNYDLTRRRLGAAREMAHATWPGGMDEVSKSNISEGIETSKSENIQDPQLTAYYADYYYQYYQQMYNAEGPVGVEGERVESLQQPTPILKEDNKKDIFGSRDMPLIESNVALSIAELIQDSQNKKKEEMEKTEKQKEEIKREAEKKEERPKVPISFSMKIVNPSTTASIPLVRPVAEINEKIGNDQSKAEGRCDDKVEQLERDNKDSSVHVQSCEESINCLLSDYIVCNICLRVFNSLSILERHEKESTLHRTNLLRKQAENIH